MTDIGHSCSGGSSCDLQSTYRGGGTNSSDDDSGKCTLENAFSCTHSDSVSSSSSSSSSSGNSDEKGYGSGSGGDIAVVKTWLKMFRTVIHQVAGDRRYSPQRPVETILWPPIMYKYMIGMSGL